MTRLEYRLVWKREGHVTASAVVAKLDTAQRRRENLLTMNPHTFCDDEAGRCEPLAPILWTRIDVRTVTDWKELGEA